MGKKFLFSPGGLLAIAVALVFSVAAISFMPSLRIDLTEDQLYTLTGGSRNIVSTLEQPLELMFFYSESATEDQPQIRAYGTRVQELLREIVIASDGNLSLRVIDPEPFSEDEDLARQYGIQSVPVSQGGEEIYFGLVVTPDLAPEETNPLAPPAIATMPLVRPDQEQFLEYEFMKLIINVVNPERTVVGLITQLSLDGGFDPQSGQATSPWFAMELIRQLYEVRRIPLTATEIDGDVDILMIVHPQDLPQQLLYAIDQHVMGGGETLVFLDPNADSMVSVSAQGAFIPAGMSSDLPGLLASWGIEYASDQVLTDNELALRVRMSQTGRPVPHLGMLGVQRQYLAQDDIITSRLETINLSSAGVIAPAENATTTFEPLIISSNDSMLMERTLLESVTDPSVLFDEFTASGDSHVIAARVTGIVNSAFPEGRPVMETEEADTDPAATESVADAPVAETTEEQLEASTEEPAAELNEDSTEEAAVELTGESTGEESDESAEAAAVHLASSLEPVNIVVYGDSDMLMDRLWVQVAQFLGQRIPQPFANNGDLLINTLDNLSGGVDLVSIRSRGTYSRPFTRVIDLQRQADDRLRLEEAELLERLAETEASLAQLNQDEQGNMIGEITPEIQAEIDRFNGELLDTRRRLRDVQFQLTEDIDRLGSRLRAINTAFIPVLLTILALLMHYARSRRRTAAT